LRWFSSNHKDPHHLGVESAWAVDLDKHRNLIANLDRPVLEW
jgi:hypothetical protein